MFYLFSIIAKMKHLWPLVAWILLSTCPVSRDNKSSLIIQIFLTNFLTSSITWCHLIISLLVRTVDIFFYSCNKFFLVLSFILNENDFHFQATSQKGFGRGPKRDVFFLNLEDGYFGCQVNESTDVLQLMELSKLCDNNVDCYRGTDENRGKLKCTSKFNFI